MENRTRVAEGGSTPPASPELPALATLAQRLEWAFARANVTGAQVAAACGVTRASVSQWVRGQTENIKLPTFFAVARTVGVDPEWLATGKASPFPEYATRESAELAVELGRLSPEVRGAITTLVRAALNAYSHSVGRARGSRGRSGR
jgi:transcriptional regulator with XRE-family HTH domain